MQARIRIIATLVCIMGTLPLHLLGKDGPSPQPIGEYSLTVNFDEVNIQSGQVRATAILDVSLPGGTGFVAIPLPFSFNEAEAVIIEPSSTHATVLRGDLRPESRFGIMLVSLATDPGRVRMVVRGTHFYLDSTSEVRSGKALQLLIGRASEDTQQRVPSVPLVRLTQLRLRSELVAETIPQSLSADGTGREHVIDFGKQFPSSDVVVYLRPPRNPLYVLYGLLGSAGLLIGLVSSLAFAPSAARAQLVLALSVIAVLILFGVFWFALTPEQRVYDTTTVVTISTLTGLLLGFIFGAIRTLAKSWSADSSTALNPISLPPAGSAPRGSPATGSSDASGH